MRKKYRIGVIADLFHQPLDEALGTGGTDFGACFKALEVIGYQGWLTIESSEGGGDAVAAVTDSVNFLKKYC